MAGKSISIIGAGVGGLSAGCYCQMNHYDTQIFEMHDEPGGLCTAWERQGYTIDGCLHWLIGSSPKSNYYHLWQEVGALQGQKILNMEQFCRIEGREGGVFTVYTNIDRLESHLKEIAPEDTAIIEEVAEAIRKLTDFALPIDKALELFGMLDNLKMLNQMRPFLGDLQKWGKMTMKDLALHFQNPFLREAWQMIWPPEFSSLYMLMLLSWMQQKNAGYVIGGSKVIARSMEKRYLALGGKIHYKSEVTKILIQNNRTVGVRLANGTEYKADYVISAVDGHATIFELLEGKYLDDKVRGYYENMPVFKPLVYVGLGVNRLFDDMPWIISGLVFALDKPIIIGNQENKWLRVRIHNFDPALAPSGKTVLTIAFESDFSYWESLHKDLARYNTEKKQIAGEIIAALDKRFPGIVGQIEMQDVSTPSTFSRYTGNWKGSYMGWLMTPGNLTLRMKKTLPGLDNFLMVGQWIQPGGGLSSGLVTGCHATQILCKGDKKKYCAICPLN